MVNSTNNTIDSRWYGPSNASGRRPNMEDSHFTNHANSIADMFKFSDNPSDPQDYHGKNSGAPQSPKPTQSRIKSFNLHEGSATNTPSSPKPTDQSLDRQIQETLKKLRQDIISSQVAELESQKIKGISSTMKGYSDYQSQHYWPFSYTADLAARVLAERLKMENKADANERRNQLEILMLAHSLLKEDMGVVKPKEADLASKTALETEKKEQSAAAASTTTAAATATTATVATIASTATTATSAASAVAAAATPSASASAANCNPPGGPAMVEEDDGGDSIVATVASSIVSSQHQKITRVGHGILYEMSLADKEKLKNSNVVKEVCLTSASAAKNLSKVGQGIAATGSARHQNYDDERRQSYEKSYDEMRAKILKAMQDKESERHRAFSHMLE